MNENKYDFVNRGVTASPEGEYLPLKDDYF